MRGAQPACVEAAAAGLECIRQPQAVSAEQQLRRELDQRELLFSEVKHRLKNNIQMVLSMLMTAQRRAASEEARSTLQSTVMKLQAAVMVHKLLEETGDHRPVRADYFLRELCRAIQNASPRRFALAIDADVSELDTAVLPSLGLIVNELLTNAIKHGIHDDRGLIRVALRSQQEQMELRIEDSGPGFVTDPGEGSGSGLGLVHALASHLHGSFRVESAAGARCIVRFPVALR
jgi:two-component sensor histidine kinase